MKEKDYNSSGRYIFDVVDSPEIRKAFETTLREKLDGNVEWYSPEEIENETMSSAPEGYKAIGDVYFSLGGDHSAGMNILRKDEDGSLAFDPDWTHEDDFEGHLVRESTACRWMGMIVEPRLQELVK